MRDVTARVAVLASGAGTNLQALLDDPVVGPWVVLAISDRAGAGALDRARGRSVEAVHIDPAAFGDRAAFDHALVEILRDRAIDLVALAGYMRIVGPELVGAFPDRILNVHPALLPAFPGTSAVADALAWGVKVTGVTVHLVDEEVDHGPVVFQEAIEVRPDDDPGCARGTHPRGGASAPARGRPCSRRGPIGGRGPHRPRGAGGAEMTDVRPVRRALLAVFDKEGVVELARELSALGVELVSSGGTAATIAAAGIDVTSVEAVTGFPEMLDGRVKTLHPKIHAGILADRRKPEHGSQLAEHGIEPIDLVVVNLYPFRETVASGAGEDDVIEKIDIGGPAMVRAAAKNFASVGVIVSPSRYGQVLDAIRAEGGLSLELRRELAAEAFAHTAAYDAAVAGWFASRDAATPAFVGLAFEKQADLRYGENPHQRGALYRASAGPGVLGGAEVLVEGKEMSFNNWLDVDAALTLAGDLAQLGPAAVIVKHNNPCGAAVRDSLAASYAAAFESDTVSAFGGIVAFGREADEDAAGAMAEVFTEVVVAPSFTGGRAGGVRRTQGPARGPSAAPGDRWPRRPCAARGSAPPGRGRRARERGRPRGRLDRGSPAWTNGVTCGSPGSSRCG